MLFAAKQFPSNWLCRRRAVISIDSRRVAGFQPTSAYGHDALSGSSGSGHALCIASTPATIAAHGRGALVGQKRDLDSIEARDIQGSRQANKRSFSTERRPELSTLADVVTGPQHFSMRFTLFDATGLSLPHSEYARLLRALVKFCKRVLARASLLGRMGARGVQNVLPRDPAAGSIALISPARRSESA